MLVNVQNSTVAEAQVIADTAVKMVQPVERILIIALAMSHLLNVDGGYIPQYGLSSSVFYNGELFAVTCKMLGRYKTPNSCGV